MFDKYNRQITYMRISVTDRCNLRCTYCMPEKVIFKDKKEILSYEQIMEVAQVAVSLGIKKIRFTGGEPLARKEIISLIADIRKLRGLEELALTTNGTLLDKMARPLKEAGLDRINISMDTLMPEKFKAISRWGSLSDVLKGIDATIDAGFKNTKINMVLKPNWNAGEVDDMKAFCQRKGLRLQRINHYSLDDIKTIDRRWEAERPLPCIMCDRIRLTADGKLKPCLFNNLEIPLDFNNLKESLTQAIRRKPKEGTTNTTTGNWQIGG
ncbi:MAG: radical SAM protein [bacterium]|nr:radical SAM protein [bacterium]